MEAAAGAVETGAGVEITGGAVETGAGVGTAAGAVETGAGVETAACETGRGCWWKEWQVSQGLRTLPFTASAPA